MIILNSDTLYCQDFIVHLIYTWSNNDDLLITRGPSDCWSVENIKVIHKEKLANIQYETNVTAVSGESKQVVTPLILIQIGHD